MTEKPTAVKIVQDIMVNKAKIRDIFGSGTGKEVLDMWLDTVADAKLFYADERTTVYAIAQRDFVLELKHIVNGEM